MDLFEFPLVPQTISPSQAFQTMKSKTVSAAVCQVGQRYYLLEAGTAFVAWKVYGDKWDPVDRGILLHQPVLNAQDSDRIGLLQAESVSASTITLSSKHEPSMARYRTGPAACYCTICTSA